jgi:NAD(P)H-dependent FMN reductase
MEALKIGLVSAGARLGGSTQKVSVWLAAELAKAPGVTVDVFDPEHPPLPPFVERLFLRPDQAALYEPLAARMKACDAFVLLTPEYNGGYSPAFKTFIDSVDPKLFAGKACGVATVGDKFDAEGRMTDAGLAKRAQTFVTDFVWLADAVAAKRRAKT